VYTEEKKEKWAGWGGRWHHDWGKGPKANNEKDISGKQPWHRWRQNKADHQKRAEKNKFSKMIGFDKKAEVVMEFTGRELLISTLKEKCLHLALATEMCEDNLELKYVK